MDGNEKVKRLFSSKIDKTAQLSIAQRGLRFEEEREIFALLLIAFITAAPHQTFPSEKCADESAPVLRQLAPSTLTYTHRHSNCVLEFPPSYLPKMLELALQPEAVALPWPRRKGYSVNSINVKRLLNYFSSFTFSFLWERLSLRNRFL